MLYRIITKKEPNERFKKNIITYNLEIEPNITPKSFYDLITPKLNNIIIEKVINYVYNILQNYIEPYELEFLMIAVDGVPTKSKIVEQKKRRYMGALISQIDEELFVKYGDDIRNNPTRNVYEEYKFNWNRANITPGTPFFELLQIYLNKEQFKVNLQDQCPNLKNIIISGSYDAGEGEKKIVDNIRSRSQESSSYLIYSPDSDVTLLGLLLSCKNNPKDPRRISNLTLMRHNQQENNYDIVNIDKLASNLFNYIKNKTKDKNLGVPDRDAVIKDIVLLLTIFGNDFVPKYRPLMCAMILIVLLTNT